MTRRLANRAEAPAGGVEAFVAWLWQRRAFAEPWLELLDGTRLRVVFAGRRWGGVVYLLWLAFDAWSSADGIAPDETRGNDHACASAFRRGLITNLLNPKAAVFYVAVPPEFLDPSAGRITAKPSPCRRSM